MTIAVNEMGAGALFYQRMLYKLTAYPEDLALPIDLWYDKNLYGKVNRIQDALVIDPKRLRTIKSGDGEIQVLDFVVDAFKDFRKFYVKKMRSGQLVSDSGIKIKPKLGWVDPQVLYHNHMKMIYSDSARLIFRERGDEISSIETFLPLFADTMETICILTPVSLTKFITSKYCTPMVSGLMIELDAQSHASDAEKSDIWLKDPNFRFYANAARMHGFMVDKNAPWRLVADIFSSAMQGYMSTYGLDKHNCFNKSYYPTHLSDIIKIRSYAYQFYSAFASANPIQSIPIVENNKTATYNTERSVLSIREYFDKYPMSVWAGFYLRLRVKEMELNWDETTLAHEATRARKLYKYLDFYSAMDYINNRTKGYYYPDSFLKQQPEEKK